MTIHLWGERRLMMSAAVIGTASARVALIIQRIHRSTRAASKYAITDLGTLGGNYSIAWGINDGGQVVGYSETSSGAGRGCLWSQGDIIDLGTLGGKYSAVSPG